MTTVSALALCGILPGVAFGQDSLVGVPGQAMTTGALTSAAGSISDQGTNNGVIVSSGANDVVALTGATISNTQANSAGLSVGSFGNAAGLLSVTASGPTSVVGASDALLTFTVGESLLLNTTAGGGTFTGGTGAGLLARSNTGANVTIQNGANTVSGYFGISASTQAVDGTIVINSTGGTIAGVDFGLVAQGNTTGTGADLSIGQGAGVTSAITTSGANGVGILANTSGDGVIDIRTGAGGTINGGGNSIAAYAGTGAVTVNVGAAIGQTTRGAGAGVLVNSGGGNIVVNSTAAIAGGTNGIYAANNGVGNITIGSTGLSATTGAGVSAFGGAGSIDFTLNGANAVQGTHGALLGTGSGAVTVTALNAGSSITGTTGRAIQVNNAGGGAIDINFAGSVTGGIAGGIQARVDGGTGGVSVTTGAVNAVAGGRAIDTTTTSGPTTIVANGAINGATGGIVATSAGAGAISVNTGSTVNGGASSGIAITNTGSGSSSIGSATQRLGGTVTAGTTGVFAVSAGDVNIYTSQVIGGTRGVVGSSQGVGANGSVVIDLAGSVLGTSSFGVIGVNNGTLLTNTLTIRTQGVTSTGGSAISAQANGGDIFVTAAGPIVANTGPNGTWDGIFADANGNANVTITAAGPVTGSFNGIDALTDQATTRGAITINAAGTVRGQTGILAVSTGQAGINIGQTTRTGAVTGTAGAGVFATSAGDVNVTVGAVSSTGGTAATIVDGSVTNATATSGFGVIGLSSGGSVNINANGLVTGGAGGGVLAQTTAATGGVAINTAGVTAAAGRGVAGVGQGGSVTINTTGPIQAAGTANFAQNNGVGVISVQSTGTVTSTTANGIAAQNLGGFGAVSVGSASQRVIGAVTGGTTGIIALGAGDVSVHAGTVTGGTRGVVAASQFANSDGRVVIDLTGPITGLTSFGIIGVNNGALSTNSLSITTADTVSSNGGSAISAQTVGGDITIIAQGAVTSTVTPAGFGGDGVYAEATQDAFIDITTNSAVSGYNGIFARTAGAGLRGGIDISAAGPVSGVFSHGISALTTTGAPITIQALGQVTGTLGGVRGIATGGTGDVSITTAGVTTTGGTAIEASVGGTGSGDVSVTVTGPALISGVTGVSAVTGGTGDVSVVATDVSSYFLGTSGSGVVAGAVGGALTVNVAGDIYGTSAVGLLTTNSGPGRIDINVGGDVTGNTQGISAISTGTGAITIGDLDRRIGGSIYGGAGAGVFASGGGNVSIFTSAVTGVGGLGVTTAANTAVTGATGANGYGVIGLSTNGAVTINTDGTVIGGLGGGILGSSGTGAVSIATADVTADFGRAIEAASSGGSITVAANGAVTGLANGIHALNSGAGSITISATGPVVARSFGAIVGNTTGTGAVNIGSVTQRLGGTVTAGTTGVFAAGAGDVSVFAGEVTGGTRGIVAAGQGVGANGAVVINTTGAITGTSSFGIIGVNNGTLSTNTLTITALGPVTSTGGSGISAQVTNGGGDITIQAGTVTANSGPNGTWDGIFADGRGDSLISITTTGAVTGTFNGIDALSTGSTARAGISILAGGSVTGGAGRAAIIANISGLGNATIGTAAGTLLSTANGAGISATVTSASGANNILVNNLAAIGGVGVAQVNNGIQAQITSAGNAGTIAINSAGGAIRADNAGIFATTVGTGTVNIGGATGIGSAITSPFVGILGATTSGDLTVRTAASGTIAPGALVGIDARTTTGAILINQAGNIGATGAGNTVGTGIYAQIAAGARDLTINSTGGIYVTPGSGLQSAGIYAVHGGTGAVNVTSTGVIDPGAYGVVVQGGGDVSYAANGGLVEGDTGVYLASTGTGTVSFSAATNTPITGFNGFGVQAVGNGGAVTLSNAGAVTGATSGIVASNTGTGATTLLVTGSVIGQTGSGIDVNGGAGVTAVMAVGNVSGAVSGISASSTGAGSTIVTNTGDIFGGSGPGIYVSSGTGGLRLNVNGDVISTSGPAILANSAGGGVINISAGAVVAGRVADADSAVIELNTASGSSSTINVAAGGVVQTVSGSPFGTAIQATGGSVVVNNSGVISGTIDFSALTGDNAGQLSGGVGTSFLTGGLSVFASGNDNFVNAGELVTLGDTTTFDFRGGVNVFTNQGTTFVGFNPIAGSTFTLQSLTTFNNSGTLQMMNGVVGDRIVATGSNYVGSGSALLSIDAVLGAPGSASDTLTIGSSSGRTAVRIRDAAPSTFGAYNPTGTLIVGGAIDAGEFVLDAGSSYYDAGLFGGALDKRGLFFSQLGTDSRGLVLISAPKVQAYQFATLGAQAQTVWDATARRSDRMAEVRDQIAEGSPAGGFWVEVQASRASRDVERDLPTLAGVLRYDASYHQDISATAIGIDGVGMGGSWIYGASVGYVQSDAEFDEQGTTVQMDGLTFGGYASYQRDGMFLAGTVSGDQLTAEIAAPGVTGFTSQEVDISSVGAELEAGIRAPFIFGSTIEPSAALTYVSTRVDNLASAGSTVRYQDRDSLRVSVGARMSGELGTFGDAADARYSLSVRGVGETLDHNDVVIDSAGPDLVLSDRLDTPYAEFRAGITGQVSGGWSAFGDTLVRYNDENRELGVTVGVRLHF